MFISGAKRLAALLDIGFHGRSARPPRSCGGRLMNALDLTGRDIKFDQARARPAPPGIAC